MSLSEINKLTEIVSNELTFIDACGQLCIDTDSVRRGVRKAFDTQAAEIERLRASLNEAVKMLSDGAADLEAEIEARRPGEIPRRIERDLETVRAMRDFITKHGGGS